MTIEVAEAMAELLIALRPAGPHYQYTVTGDRYGCRVRVVYTGPGRGFTDYDLHGPNGVAQHIRDEMFYDLEVRDRG